MNARPPESVGDLACSVSGSGGTEQRRAERAGVRDGGVARCRARRCRSGSSARPAVRATSTGSRPVVVLPSESSTIADGGRLPSAACRCASVSSATCSASPVAVAPSATLGVDRSRRRASWSVLGACVAVGRVGEGDDADAHRRRAACRGTCAAARLRRRAGRSGSTSVASIEREWSVTSMIDARSTGTATVRCGLASASASAASAASSQRGRQRGGARRATAPAASASARHGGEAHRVAAGARRAAGSCSSAHGTASGASSSSGEHEAQASGGEAHRSLRPSSQQPVVARCDSATCSTCSRRSSRGQRRRGARPRARRSARARAGATCRPRRARPSRGRPRRAPDRRELGLARVADLDGEHGVAGAQRAERARPVVLVAEVGDDDDEARLARDAARRGPARRPARAARGRRRRATPSPSARRSATTPGLRAARRQQARLARRRRSSAPRGRRGARPAGRARARRPRRRRPSGACAVPKAIDGETSSTIHVVSVRSGTCRRTCGSPVRAVAAASIWRTSSPTS